MEMTVIVTILVYVVLIIFLIVLSCIIHQFQAQTKVHATGHVTLPQQCQIEMQECANMKNLQKIKTLRSDRKISLSLSSSSKPNTRSSIWTTSDIMEKLSEDQDERIVNDPGTQASKYYQNKVHGEITEIMTSIQKDLQNQGIFLDGPEATNNLRKSATEEWNNSFNEKKVKY